MNIQEAVEQLVAESVPFHHFDTMKLLKSLNLEVLGNELWSIDDYCDLRQRLQWSAEDAIAYVAGKMLDAEVRKRVLEARVFEP